jgi:hypothetical protein
MESEHLLVLEMVQGGKISVCEALDLLEALNDSLRAGQPQFSPDGPLTIEVSLE